MSSYYEEGERIYSNQQAKEQEAWDQYEEDDDNTCNYCKRYEECGIDDAHACCEYEGTEEGFERWCDNQRDEGPDPDEVYDRMRDQALEECFGNPDKIFKENVLC